MRIEPRAQLGDPERGFDDYVLDAPADAAEAPVAFSMQQEETPKDESIDEKTGEPKHPAVIWASTALFVVASIFAFGCYWFYWWRAIHMGTFAHSANLIAWLDPRPGSAGSIVAVCILAAVGRCWLPGFRGASRRGLQRLARQQVVPLGGRRSRWHHGAVHIVFPARNGGDRAHRDSRGAIVAACCGQVFRRLGRIQRSRSRTD